LILKSIHIQFTSSRDNRQINIVPVFSPSFKNSYAVLPCLFGRLNLQNVLISFIWCKPSRHNTVNGSRARPIAIIQYGHLLFANTPIS